MPESLPLQPKMSISQAAEFLGVSPQTVHYQIKGKNLSCPKMGNKIYITHSIAKQLFNLKFNRRIIVGQIVKGGTGKTTTIHNISCCANAYGARVLAIDIDPQANLTDAFNYDSSETPVLIDFVKNEAKLQAGIVNIADGLDLIPSRIENVVVDSHLIYEKIPLHTFFSELLSPVIDNYDFIFIDCPPTLGLSVTAAALFSDIVIAPLNPDKFSAKGLKILKQEFLNLNRRYKKEINFKVFLNKFSSNTILSEKAVATIIADPDMEGKTMQTAVRLVQEVPRATDTNKSLFDDLRKSSVRDDFDRLTRELLEICPN